MTRRDTRLDGLNPLAYMGVNPDASPLLFTNNRAPRVNDKTYDIGTLWIDRTTLDLWMLINLDGHVATWIRFATSGNAVLDFITDAGTAIAAASILQWIGDGATATDASVANTVEGGFASGTDGQLFIGDGATMALANITSTGGTITITNGANTINLEDPGTAGINQMDGDSGSATPIANNVQFLGGTNITTQATGDTIVVTLDLAVTLSGTLWLSALPAGVMQTDATGLVTSNNGTDGQVLVGGGTEPQWVNITSTGGSIVITNGPNTINIENPAASGISDLAGDSGTATPIAGNVQMLGGTNITTAAASDTLTINLDNNVTLSGTLTLSPLGAGVMQTNGSGVVTSDNGTDGQLIIGATGGAPAWGNITSTGGTVTITNGANTINVDTAVAVDVDDTSFLLSFDGVRLESGPYKPLGGSTPTDAGYEETTIHFDPGNNIYDWVGGMTYTAPEDGKYNFSAAFRGYENLAQDDVDIRCIIDTSNRTFTSIRNTTLPNPWGTFLGDAETLNVVLDLDAADTVKVYYVLDRGFPLSMYMDSDAYVGYWDIETFACGFYIGA